ncbi:hypothetical protein [uncultured Piscinibacter sp.]|uniref:hypothetical protein n=1 Tax=uncultured Piscinibacter sp. TaxID=1131835 RepID=UPI00261F35DE|nr:hypothetical protein [uncultured Piscinibacter sp.]
MASVTSISNDWQGLGCGDRQPVKQWSGITARPGSVGAARAAAGRHEVMIGVRWKRDHLAFMRAGRGAA